jgi:small subunit ribosomal protein S16
MAVKMRLRRMGTKQTPFYRVVVADERAARDGRILEMLGTYDPRQEGGFKVNVEKALRWLEKGAQPTDTVRSLLRGAGVLKQRAEAKRGQAAAPSA